MGLTTLRGSSAPTKIRAMMSHGPKSYLRALVLLAILVLPTKSAIANVLSLADYDDFHNLDLRMRPIANDLDNFLIHPPMPRGAPQAAIEAAVRTQNCMIQLIGNFDAVGAKLYHVGTLVGLAAKMTDSADELLVRRLLSLSAGGFLEQLKDYRRMLNSTLEGCSQDGATVAKSQEILRIYSEGAALVQSLIKKIGAERK